MIKRFFATLAAALLMPVAAWAVPITYIYSGTGSGSLGGTNFSSTGFIITAQADTDNIAPWSSATLQNTHSSATVTLLGFGTFTLTAPTHTWIADNCCLGIGADLSSNYLTLFNPAIVSVGYALATDIGPILDATASTQNQFVGIETSGGDLSISQLNGASFQAITSAVPETSASVLMALGLAGIGLAARRRRN
ncbi:MAG: hypothetical protein KA141_08875 [Rubrivivax sp.]|jgi:MYXO-CTERM domain-containing protein|nr:hypothetical protein [Rubrivivax sp.]